MCKFDSRLGYKFYYVDISLNLIILVNQSITCLVISIIDLCANDYFNKQF